MINEELFENDVNWGQNVEDVDNELERQKGSGQALIIRKLRKEFKDKVAVDQMNLDIYEGQIFALLGHNGAGKTTTISMMCGMIPPTSGDLKIKDMYLSRDLGELRRSLGVCPQQNVIFNDLTPYEHLYLFSIFKGMKDQKIIHQKIEEKLKEVGLAEKRDRQAKSLSGGQKRKLCLALALIGDSKIVMLDEPTSGMDLTARRQMWDMLKNNKNNRIIILTTHYMEEADILADRIAIMSQGKLECLGSSLFLKKKYGVGYYLTIVKEQGVSSPSHTKRINEFISNYIKDANLMSDVHAEISFQLPMSSTSKFTEFFTDLDKSLTKLELRSYGVSVTTLEEVFLKVARGENDDKNQIYGAAFEKEIDFVLSRDRIKTSLFLNHFIALLRKRIIWTKRDIKSLAYEIFIPILLVTFGLTLMLVPSPFTRPHKHSVNIDNYDTPQSILYGWNENATVDSPFNILNFNTSEAMNSFEYQEERLGKSYDELNGTIENFDSELYKKRDDPKNFRMGSYYLNKMDKTADQYEPVIFHNQSAFQATGAYYNYITNKILHDVDSRLSVKVYNYPLPYPQNFKSAINVGFGFIATVVFSLGFSFIPAGIIVLIVKERESNIKHQHVISGVSRLSYWSANYLWDAVKHITPAVVSTLVILAYDIEVFVNPASSYGAV